MRYWYSAESFSWCMLSRRKKPLPCEEADDDPLLMDHVTLLRSGFNGGDETLHSYIRSGKSFRNMRSDDESIPVTLYTVHNGQEYATDARLYDIYTEEIVSGFSLDTCEELQSQVSNAEFRVRLDDGRYVQIIGQDLFEVRKTPFR